MRNSLKAKVKIATVVTALSMILSSQSVLAVTPKSTIGTEVSNVNSAAAALNYLNDIRSKMGIQAMKLDPTLTQAASNHANYLLVNQENGHTETSGKQGYTGERPWDRAGALGFDTDKFGVFEDVSFDTDSPEKGVQSLLDAPLHRSSLILPDMTLLGVGYNQHAVVLNPAKAWYTHTGVGVYPYDGQTGVPIGFYGFEVPNPLEQFGLEKSGYFITYAGVAQDKEDISASMIDSAGKAVDILKLKQELGDTNAWHLIPKQELTYGETYTVTVEDKTWSFTTKENPDAPKTDHTTNPTKVDPPKQFSSNDVGIRINGKYVDVSPKARIIEGNTLIPLRGVFEAIGANVLWEGSRKEVTIHKDATTIVLTIGTNQALVNGNRKTISSVPFISSEGSTYVPLRFVSEALGAQVAWESDKWTAVINGVN
ncbi:hypothetical protein A8709_18970 [Paenibacillus pectinilyticus]|uniref:Copper amine oxidase n=1 Tax=Paenibacillus pectinilyticus TaxID=512399 RepID=A0A1C1A056_9BACL|nr:stalk domain-containing protein [Paenibacillus pectinilyticus]OCT13671.1 hypothetical protein A8709_18970 [Paenibacillus pectinilyticus]